MPKDVVQIAPKEYVDRFGQQFRVVDPPEVSPYLTRGGEIQ